MEIRRFRPDDLPLLREMTMAAFDGVSIDQGMEQRYGIIQGKNWQWRKARHVDLDVQRNAEGIHVLDDDGRVVGFISTWIDHEAGIGHIPNLVLIPEYRGQGLGRKLIQHALDGFRAQGVQYAKIETLEQNVIGTSLYTSLGFHEVARQIHFLADISEPRRTSGIADPDEGTFG